MKYPIILDSEKDGNRCLRDATTDRPNIITDTADEGFWFPKNLKIARRFVSMFQSYRISISQKKLIGLIMIGDTFPATLNGPLDRKITGIRRALTTSFTTAKGFVSLLLLKNIPNWITLMLEGLLRKVYRQNKYLKSRAVNVYDLMNVETSSRFAALDGHLYHNCLAISFLMTKYGLAIKLTNDTGREWTEDEAQEQIDMFFNAYPELHDYQEQLKDDYSNGCGLVLPCGWRFGPDSDNLRSVVNCPIQGTAGSIMRKAVDFAEARGCKILFTLHDALFLEGNVGEEHLVAELRDAMRDAFVYYWDAKYKATATQIKLDPFIWGESYQPDSVIHIEGWEVPCSNLYVDQRSIGDYLKFSKYFNKHETDLL